MQPLIDIIEQLGEDERIAFTSWFSSLSVKEREAVASVIAKTTLERIRTLLSIPAENRVALFLVPTNPDQERVKKQWQELKKALKGK
jgi:hypothetical protein